MADNTKIEWTDATWNPITGCSIVSPGCTNCYAMKLAGTRLKHHPSRAGLTRDSKAGPVWTGEVRFNREWLDQPLRWTKPRMIFVCAHGDLFAEGVEDAWLDQIFAVMALAKQHVFQVLTKRPERMRDYLQDMGDGLFGHDGSLQAKWGQAAVDVADSPCAAGAMEDIAWPLKNVWFGVSVEDQKRADERIPLLLATPAAVRWVSAEPLLGPVDFTRIPIDPDPLPNGQVICMDALAKNDFNAQMGWDTIDWIVAGGESGPDARPMHPDWARDLRDQCAAAGVAFHFKQWGEWTPGENVISQKGVVPVAHYLDDIWDYSKESLSRTDGHIDDEPDVYRVGKREAGRRLDGVEHDGFPPLPAGFLEARS
jgi:protein gp37